MLTRSFQLYSSGPLPVTLSCNTRMLSNNDNNSNKQNNNFTHTAHILVHFFAFVYDHYVRCFMEEGLWT